MAQFWSDAAGRRAPRAATVLLLGLLAAGCGVFDEDELILEGQRIPVRASADDLRAPADVAGFLAEVPVEIALSDWTQVNGTSSHSVGHIQAGGVLSQVWSADVGVGGSDEGRITSSPIVVGGSIYAMDAAAQVAAFDASSGALRWRIDLTPEGEDGEDGFGGGLAFDDGRLFATTGFGQVFALDPSNGGELWRQNAGAPVRAAPAAADGRVFVVARDDIAYALDADTGALLWRLEGAAGAGAGALGGASIAVNGELTLVPFSTGELVAAQASTGRRLWSEVLSGGRRELVRGTISDVSGDPVIAGLGVYASNQSGRMIALDGRNGRRAWTRSLGSTQPVWAVGRTLFAMTDDGRVMRLGADDGSTLWSTQLPQYGDPEDREDVISYGGPVLAGGRVLVTSTEGELLLFDPVTGEETGRRDLPAGAINGPVVAGGTVYVLTDEADLVAFR